MIGDAGVGKTCAVQRFKHGIYIERHGNTIGVDFMLKTIEVDGKRLKVLGFCRMSLIQALLIGTRPVHNESTEVQNARR